MLILASHITLEKDKNVNQVSTLLSSYRTREGGKKAKTW
jgi:hypothetical protein